MLAFNNEFDSFFSSRTAVIDMGADVACALYFTPLSISALF
jgi:hypothetical protein